MPCRNDVVVHSFPADFGVDTHYFSQALAEHNADRADAGLSVADFFSLSEAERHDVLWRAQKLKSAARYTPIQMAPHAPVAVMKSPSQLDLERTRNMLSSLGVYLFALGIVGMVALLWKILG
jgi:hypothetical protein